MATDIRVVVPSDIGSTIRLGAREPNKLDVDVSMLNLPANIESMQLVDGVLSIITGDGNNPSVDLKPLLPTVVSDLFLKSVEKVGNDLVFTVGNKGNTTNDTQLMVSVSDLLPVKTVGVALAGDGTTDKPLQVSIYKSTDNLLVSAYQSENVKGLLVDKTTVVNAVLQALPERPVRLVNASGDTVVGYIYSTER